MLTDRACVPDTKRAWQDELVPRCPGCDERIADDAVFDGTQMAECVEAMLGMLTHWYTVDTARGRQDMLHVYVVLSGFVRDRVQIDAALVWHTKRCWVLHLIRQAGMERDSVVVNVLRSLVRDVEPLFNDEVPPIACAFCGRTIPHGQMFNPAIIYAMMDRKDTQSVESDDENDDSGFCGATTTHVPDEGAFHSQECWFLYLYATMGTSSALVALLLAGAPNLYKFSDVPMVRAVLRGPQEGEGDEVRYMRARLVQWAQRSAQRPRFVMHQFESAPQ